MHSPTIAAGPPPPGSHCEALCARCNTLSSPTSANDSKISDRASARKKLPLMSSTFKQTHFRSSAAAAADAATEQIPTAGGSVERATWRPMPRKDTSSSSNLLLTVIALCNNPAMKTSPRFGRPPSRKQRSFGREPDTKRSRKGVRALHVSWRFPERSKLSRLLTQHKSGLTNVEKNEMMPASVNRLFAKSTCTARWVPPRVDPCERSLRQWSLTLSLLSLRGCSALHFGC
mmetsp:Transcript_156585/g.502634  ORF Transcript_156585/g.502634 Transcript_156585/m.502634 type:complete len:231 (-) Transcript_156585:2458-3150(-)